MLSKEGYASLFKVWLLASGAIRGRMASTIDALRGNPDQRLSWGTYRSNVDIAARYLAYDVIFTAVTEGRGSVSIMRPDGGLIGLSGLLLAPPDMVSRGESYYNARQEARKLGLIPRREKAFGLETLRQDFWQLPFLEGEVFKERKLSRRSYAAGIYDEVSLIDWNVGAIDLSRVRAFVEGFKQLREAYFTLKPLGYQFPHHYADMFESEHEGEDEAGPCGILKMLSPFEGCAIVVPKEFLTSFDEFLSGEQQKGIDLIQHVSVPPKDAILRLLDENPQFSKADVRRELFSNVSHRKFESFWARAAEERSDLSKPGRKTAKS